MPPLSTDGCTDSEFTTAAGEDTISDAMFLSDFTVEWRWLVDRRVNLDGYLFAEVSEESGIVF